jgi:hypothetical protein
MTGLFTREAGQPPIEAARMGSNKYPVSCPERLSMSMIHFRQNSSAAKSGVGSRPYSKRLLGPTWSRVGNG